MKEQGTILSDFLAVKGVVARFLGALVILGEVWFLMVSVPRQINEVRTLQESQTDISLEVNELDRAVRVLAGVDSKKLATELAKVDAALPGQKKTSGLIVGIGRIASASGMTIRQLDFSPGKISTESAVISDEIIPGSAAKRVSAQLSMVGDWPRLMLFLSKIQAASQMIGIETLSYTGLGAAQHTVDIGLQVFYEPVSNVPINWNSVRPLSSSEEAVVLKLPAIDVFTLPGEGR